MRSVRARRSHYEYHVALLQICYADRWQAFKHLLKIPAARTALSATRAAFCVASVPITALCAHLRAYSARLRSLLLGLRSLLRKLCGNLWRDASQSGALAYLHRQGISRLVI